MLSRFISVILLAHSAFGQMAALSNVTTAFSMAQIVPDVIDSFNPTDLINITFIDSVSMDMVDVDPGDLLTMEQTADEPLFILDTSLSGGSDSSNTTSSMNVSTFVVLMVDPDAPTPQMPNVSEFLHFLGGDFTADSTSGLLSNSSPALMEFFSPTPPPGSDPHRYVVLVFNQPDDFDTNGPMFVNGSTPRTNFSATDFAQETNLGMPIAGNFFLVGPSNDTSSSSSTDAGATPTDTTIPTDTAPPSAPITSSPLNLPSPQSTIPLATSPSVSQPPPPVNTSRGISFKICRSDSSFMMGIVLVTLLVYLV